MESELGQRQPKKWEVVGGWLAGWTAARKKAMAGAKEGIGGRKEEPVPCIDAENHSEEGWRAVEVGGMKMLSRGPKTTPTANTRAKE